MTVGKPAKNSSSLIPFHSVHCACPWEIVAQINVKKEKRQALKEWVVLEQPVVVLHRQNCYHQTTSESLFSHHHIGAQYIISSIHLWYYRQLVFLWKPWKGIFFGSTPAHTWYYALWNCWWRWMEKTTVVEMDWLVVLLCVFAWLTTSLRKGRWLR